MSTDVPAATWKVRVFTPGVTEEFEVEIDPRAGNVVGETRRIEEGARGATLEREAAVEIAMASLRRMEVDEAELELKDVIAIPMPDRRDWLLHFEREAPLAEDAWMRVDVKLAGNRVVHVGRTVRIPETVRREAEESDFVNALLFFARVVGAIFLLVVAGAGAVVAFRDGGLRWKSALRATALLALPAGIAGALPFALAARGYQTSIDWDTFVVRQAILTFEGVSFQLFIVFLSLVTISVCVPWTTSLRSPASRGRVAVDAVVRALAATAVISALLLSGDAIELLTRVGLDVSSPVSDRAAIPLPFVASGWQAIMMSAWVAALSVSSRAYLEQLRSTRAARLSEFAIVLALSIFLADSSARPADMPFTLVHASLTGLALWLVAKHLFAPNPLAVPPAILLLTTTDDILSWVRSGRPDLQTNAVILTALVVGAFVWILAARRESSGPDREDTGARSPA